MNAVLDPSAPLATLPLQQVMERAQAMQVTGQLEAAAALYGRWIAASPGPLKQVACFNQGTLLSAAKREAEAEAAYLAALVHEPDFPPARLNLGHLLERRGDSEGALAQWAVVIEKTARTAQQELHLHALNNSARLLETLKRLPEAMALMRRSLEINPGQMDVVQHYVHVRQKQCIWPLYEAFGGVTLNRQLVGTSALAMMSVSDDPALQLMAAQRFASERAPREAAEPLHQSMPPRSGKVRIGYLSGDLHHHAVGLLIPELIELHDRSRFEVHAFCWTPDSDSPQRARLLRAFDQHTRLSGVDDHTAARLVAEAGIDVLVDLQALTSGARPGILAQRPAPVQVSYLGLPGTSGLPGVDWLVGDAFTLPPELEPFCTERPIRLPTCYQVSDRRREVGPAPERAALGLPEKAFVFCSFNNTFKFTETMFAAWMRILRAVPDSVLWLLADNDAARGNLQRAAVAAGMPAERLVFAGRVAPSEYLARFRAADLMLDTFPYNAGTTASDALWAGTPLVTLAGRSYISRMAGSLLTHVGLPDLVTHSLDEYERLAITIGRNPARASSYRRYLADEGRRSPLFDQPRIVAALENEFERLALQARAARPTRQP